MTEFITNEVRNEQGIWLNSQIFREEGLHFMKNKYYCPDPVGTPSWRDYWDEQLARCINGYTSGGVKITQHHYFYLNFTQIKIVDESEDGSVVRIKEIKAPEFWDGDYNFFWAKEISKNGLFSKMSLVPSTKDERDKYWILEKERIAIIESKYTLDSAVDTTNIDNLLKENSDKRYTIEEIALNKLKLQFTIEVNWRDGGHNIVVGKSRRKGYSYKNAAICANTYNTIRKSLSLIGAFDKKYLYPRGTMAMTSEFLSFLNLNTAWGKGREYVDREEHRRASFQERKDGKPIESGYLSEVMAVTFKDNPEAARGKDAVEILLEECGMFPNLLESIRKTADATAAGKYITGQITAFGTGGDMEKGTTDFAALFYDPEQDNFMPFINIWDEDAENSTCGFFHPTTWNAEGLYDDQGNSDITRATIWENEKRQQIIHDSSDSGAIQQRMQEHPFNPSEAFLITSANDFPVVELRNHLNKVKRDKLHLKYGQPVYLTKETLDEPDTIDPLSGIIIKGRKYKIKATPDLDSILQPIWDYKLKDKKNLKGSVVIYEYPMERPPKGLFKIGFDPYRQQSSSETNPSLAAVYVYKSHHKFSYTRDTIVASYIGRPYNPDDVNRIVEMLAELYNAEIMYENEITHVKDYFIRRKKVHLLAIQPDSVIARLVKESVTKRIWGVHMSEKIKDGGEKYIKQWLLEERDFDEDGKVILNLETIYDIGLLEELIKYYRKGNFDRVMAFMMLMLQLADEEENKTYGENKTSSNSEDLLELMKKQFRRPNSSSAFN